MFPDDENMDRMFFGERRIQRLKAIREQSTRFGLVNQKCRFTRQVVDLSDIDVAVANDPAEVAASRELLCLINEEIHKLVENARDQQIVIQRLFFNVPYKELSKSFGRRSDTIRSVVSKTRAKLKKRFHDLLE